MLNRSRALRESAVRALAKVGLVWALAVLGFVFTAGATVDPAHTDQTSTASASSHAFGFVNTGEAPRTAGLALALVVLGGGLTVLAVGGLRTPTASPASADVPRLATPGDLSLSFGVDLTPAASAA